VEARLREQARGNVTAVVTGQTCASASENTEVNNPDFRKLYPEGLFVLCNSSVAGGTAHATLLRYLFNSSQSRVLVASRIEATLLLQSGVWRVTTWRQSFTDYAAP
jgi:hypothetical protein